MNMAPKGLRNTLEGYSEMAKAREGQNGLEGRTVSSGTFTSLSQVNG